MTAAPRIPGGYRKVPNALVRSSLSDGAIRAYMVLDFYRKDNEAAWPSRKNLAAEMACSEATVDRRLRELEAAGWITSQGYRGGYKGTVVYTVNVAPGDPGERPKRQPNRGQFKSGSTVTSDGTSTAGSTVIRAASPLTVTSDEQRSTTKNDSAADPAAGAEARCTRCGESKDVRGFYRDKATNRDFVCDHVITEEKAS